MHVDEREGIMPSRFFVAKNRGGNIVKLIIAEKPSVSKSLAALLGAKDRKDGYFVGNGYIVSWCYGHLVELARPAAYEERYKRWAYMRCPFCRKPCNMPSGRKRKSSWISCAPHARDDVESVMNPCRTPA
jgi:DNA topoisomerase-3